MKIAVFSDIHGNKEALEAIIEDIKKENINEIICLGDILGIGPNPKECMSLIINNNIHMVLGNHELYFLKGTDIDDEMGEGEIVHQKWVKEQLTDSQKSYLEKCSMTIEKEYNGKKLLFVHFPIDYNSKNQYPFHNLKIVNNGSIKNIMESLNYDLIFIGHEHKDFCIDNKLYDVGSSGCRKDDTTRYTIFDTDNFRIETKIINFNRDNFVSNLLKYEYPNRNIIAKCFFGVGI